MKLKIISSSDEILSIDDFKIDKDEQGLYFVKLKDTDVPYTRKIGYVSRDKNRMKVYQKLQNEIYKHNTKNSLSIKKKMITKLGKLFKSAEIPRQTTMSSRIRGYRPVVNAGYYFSSAGSRTSFAIYFSNDSSAKKYRDEIKKILDKEKIKYEDRNSFFTVDINDQ